MKKNNTNQINISQLTIKHLGYGLLIGAVITSIIFYLISMVYGFRIPSSSNISNINNLSMYDIKQKINDSNIIHYYGSLSDIGIFCIFMACISFVMLFASTFIFAKYHIKVSHIMEIMGYCWCLLLIITLVFVLIGKPDFSIAPVLQKRDVVHFSIWFKENEHSASNGSVITKFEYTSQAVIVVSILSILSIVPLTFTILFLMKIRVQNKK